MRRRLASVDPHGQGFIKGLRLVAAYGGATAAGSIPVMVRALPDGASLAALAAGFALWASVSELRERYTDGVRDLVVFAAAAVAGAATMMLVASHLPGRSHPASEFILIAGAFLVGFLRRFGVTGAGIGSQVYIGQLLAFNAQLGASALPTALAAGAIALIATVVSRLLTAPFERRSAPPPPAAMPQTSPHIAPEAVMGAQAALAALAILALSSAFHLIESAWAITAGTYVIASSATATADRVRRRIAGTLIGVPLGLAFLPLTEHVVLAVWAAAASAMILYAVSLPKRYDIACGAYAFTLIVTLAIDGQHSIAVLAARAWETILGAVIGLAVARFVVPVARRR